MPMWTHYSAAHSGFAIGFDMESDLFSSAKMEQKLRKVKYLEERVSLTRGPVGPDEILFSKSIDWQYEEEWRWIERGNPDDYAEVVRAKNGDLLFLRQIPAQCIQELILGCRIRPTLAGSLQGLRSTPSYNHLKLFTVELDESRYKLRIIPLPS